MSRCQTWMQKLRVQMRIEISKLHQRLGATIIYVTHDQTEAMTLGTRIVVMKDGVVQQVDSPQNLYNNPCNLFVAGFIGSPQMNFLDATVKVSGNDVALQVGNHSIKLAPAKAKKLIDGGYNGKTVILGIRPEDVHDSDEWLKKSPETVIESTIRVYELLGAEVFLYFDVEGANVTARVDPRTTARTGDTVKFALDAEKIHVFDKETELVITKLIFIKYFQCHPDFSGWHFFFIGWVYGIMIWKAKDTAHWHFGIIKNEKQRIK